MEQPQHLSPAFEGIVEPAPGRPVSRRAEASENRLDVAVVYTSPSGTLAALRRAGALADQLGARVALIVPQVVPFPLPLASPPVLREFTHSLLRQIAAECPAETRVRIFLCRDRLDLLKDALAAHALVIIGGPRRWWPTRETRTARHLRRAGHAVIFTETE